MTVFLPRMSFPYDGMPWLVITSPISGVAAAHVAAPAARTPTGAPLTIAAAPMISATASADERRARNDPTPMACPLCRIPPVRTENHDMRHRSTLFARIADK